MDLSIIEGYKADITDIINLYLVPILIALAFATFLWGIYKYFIRDADSEAEREKGKTFALYGIIGLVIIFSVWGIVNIFKTTLGLPYGTAPNPPTIGTSTTKGERGAPCSSKKDCISNACGTVTAGECE